MTDDPLFDPWWTPPESGASSDAVPAPTPAPKKWRSNVPAPGPQQIVRTARAIAPVDSRTLATSTVSTDPRPKPKPQPTLRVARPLVDLRELIVPPLADIRQRLEMARHETTVDDRLDEAAPSIRFRVQPHAGPFDEATTIGSVLEVRLEAKPSPRVVGRLWMDPNAAGPAEECAIEVDRVTRDWVDALLLDFLVKTLKLA